MKKSVPWPLNPEGIYLQEVSPRFSRDLKIWVLYLSRAAPAWRSKEYIDCPATPGSWKEAQLHLGGSREGDDGYRTQISFHFLLQVNSWEYTVMHSLPVLPSPLPLPTPWWHFATTEGLQSALCTPACSQGVAENPVNNYVMADVTSIPSSSLWWWVMKIATEGMRQGKPTVMFSWYHPVSSNAVRGGSREESNMSSSS